MVRLGTGGLYDFALPRDDASRARFLLSDGKAWSTATLSTSCCNRDDIPVPIPLLVTVVTAAELGLRLPGTTTTFDWLERCDPDPRLCSNEDILDFALDLFNALPCIGTVAMEWVLVNAVTRPFGVVGMSCFCIFLRALRTLSFFSSSSSFSRIKLVSIFFGWALVIVGCLMEAVFTASLRLELGPSASSSSERTMTSLDLELSEI